MTDKYNIIWKNRIIAIGYVTPHPYFEGHCIASILPISRKGKWEDDTLEVTFQKLLSDIYRCTKSDEEILNELLAQDRTEPWKCKIVRAETTPSKQP